MQEVMCLQVIFLSCAAIVFLMRTSETYRVDLGKAVRSLCIAYLLGYEGEQHCSPSFLLWLLAFCRLVVRC